MKAKQSTLVAQRLFGDLGLEERIIDHATLGRLLVRMGDTCRWRDGAVYRLQSEDTFDSLAEEWNHFVDHHEAIVRGFDSERPPLEAPYALGVLAAHKISITKLL